MKRTRCLWLLLLVLLLAGCGAQTASIEMQAAMRDAYERGRSEALESSGYNNEYKSGYEEGYDKGVEVGNSQGFASGYQRGKDEGYAAGYETGSEEGKQKGYDEGYAKGVQDVNAALEAERTQTEPEPIPNYVANTNSKKFHLPDCSSVNDIKAENRKDWYGSREELIDEGYVPCQRCNP